jgi:hypothetical protein
VSVIVWAFAHKKGSAMRIAFLVASLVSCCSLISAAPATRPTRVDEFAFLKNYRSQHYLETAIEFQKQAPDQRAANLRALAKDPNRASEVFPLCRMLFEGSRMASSAGR